MHWYHVTEQWAWSRGGVQDPASCVWNDWWIGECWNMCLVVEFSCIQMIVSVRTIVCLLEISTHVSADKCYVCIQTYYIWRVVFLLSDKQPQLVRLVVLFVNVQEKRRQYDMATAKDLANDAVMVCACLTNALVTNVEYVLKAGWVVQHCRS